MFKVYCDRCKKQIKGEAIRIRVIGWLAFGTERILCGQCFDEFKKLWKEGEKKKP